MAKSDKTEKATPQRRAKARREGQIARSAELPVFAGLATTALALRVFGPEAVHAIGSATAMTFGSLTGDTGGLGEAGRTLGTAAAWTLAPFLGAAVVSALAAGLYQTRFALSPKAAKPKLSAISPKQGLKRFTPAKAGWELARTALKIGALFLVVWSPLLRLRDRLLAPGGIGIDAVLSMLWAEVWTVLVRAVLLALVIAVADYAYQRWQFERELRMSKSDVKQEHKNTEGDPLVKGERRRRQQAMSRNRMLADVGKADVVLVNPTDFAIALRYDPGEPAPKVLAKGADHLAARIRAEAARQGVPVHVDVPLCRALYRQVEVGSFVPQAMFDAIAVVLVWAYRRTGRRPGSTGATATGVRGTRPPAMAAAGGRP